MKQLYLLFTTILFFPLVNWAQPGALDMSFAKNGIGNYTIDQQFGDIRSTFSLITSNGKIILGGNNGNLLSLVRLKTNGSIDSSFGGDGKILWSSGTKNNIFYRSGVLQPDGKLVVIADDNEFNLPSTLYILRFNTDGSVDNSFGGSGKVLISANGVRSTCGAIAVQTDGKLVIAGSQGTANNYKVLVLRLTVNGSLDPGFNHGSGMKLYHISTKSDYGTSVAIQTDGKIIVGGYSVSNVDGDGYDFSVARLTTNGSFDNSFDNDGKKLIDLDGNSDFLSKALIQTDGKIVLAGSSQLGKSPSDFSIARLNADGSIDNRFNSIGYAVISVGSYDACEDAVIQPDGKIIMCGQSENLADDEDVSSIRLKTNGTIDSNFGTNGKFMTSINTVDDASGILLQSNGKIVLTGYTEYNIQTQAEGELLAGNYAALRLTVNGNLDNTFNNNGENVIPAGSFNDEGNAALIIKQGKILLAGTSLTAVNPPSVTNTGSFIRLNKTGLRDSNLNTDGHTQVTDFLLNDISVNAATIDSNSKILTAGRMLLSDNDFFIARYRPFGVPDSSFANYGFAYININGNDTATCMAVQTDNKVVVAGNSYGSFGATISIIRLSADGTPDHTFNGNGTKTIASGFGVRPLRTYAVTLQPDGKILIAGAIDNLYLFSNNYDFSVIRLNVDGSYDNTFGSGGKVSVQVGSSDDICYAMQLQADGKIVLAGSALNNSQTDFAVVRLNANGTPDNTFNGNGKITIAVSNLNDVAKSLAIQPDGKIVVAGYTYNGTDNDAAVVRLNSNGSFDNTFDIDGKLVFNYVGTDEIINAVNIQDDGKIVMAGKQKPLNESYGSSYFVMRLQGGNSINAAKQINAVQHRINYLSLEQNFPNPFNNATTINYTLPQTYTSAKIIITDKNGNTIKEVNVTGNGKGSIRVNASTLAGGVYQYSLYINDKFIEMKQMVIQE